MFDEQWAIVDGDPGAVAGATDSQPLEDLRTAHGMLLAEFRCAADKRWQRMLVEQRTRKLKAGRVLPPARCEHDPNGLSWCIDNVPQGCSAMRVPDFLGCTGSNDAINIEKDEALGSRGWLRHGCHQLLVLGVGRRGRQGEFQERAQLGGIVRETREFCCHVNPPKYVVRARVASERERRSGARHGARCNLVIGDITCQAEAPPCLPSPFRARSRS